MPNDDESTIPIPSRYPRWLMDFVAPEQTKRSYQERHAASYAEKSKAEDHPPDANSTSDHSLTIPSSSQQSMKASTSSSPPKPSNTKKPHPRRLRTRAEQDEADQEEMSKFARRLFAEFLGTSIFVYLVGGLGIEVGLTGLGLRPSTGLNQTGAGFADGITLAFLIYAMGPISGAHFNPVVTSDPPPH